ncbi:unnamed protein product [Schistosoma mattheei]|uniref:Uncharacterized protein n=1 Tax=Schistosoma mattheei TaxID=31246 RepID=A0A183P564_9TREM|nr:unnamed protein product [Schistosoma mattheei]
MEVDISNNPSHETNMDTTSEWESAIPENAEKHKNQIVGTEELVTTTCSDDSALLGRGTCTDSEANLAKKDFARYGVLREEL